MIQTLFDMPVEGGRNPEGFLVADYGLLYLALGRIYIAEETMTLTDSKLFTSVREEFDRVGYRFLRSLKPLVTVQRPGKNLQRVYLSRYVIEPFVNF